MKQPWAWIGWLFVTIVILSITRNPLYLVLILICILFVGVNLRQAGIDDNHPLPVWKLAGWIILLATIFNALISHFGQTVLFTVPGNLPLISGHITLEALVYGATNGLVLTGILASFTVLNQALPIRDLISLIPRAFFPLAVVTSIAVTYLPTTLRQFRQIREAQAIRGHQMRTLRDWLPLWMPLLVGGLEHAMQLAEAMTARGFASARHVSRGSDIFPRLSMLFGLMLMVVGWLSQLADSGLAGLVMIICGAVAIFGGLWIMSRKSPRTVYHRKMWRWQDWLGLFIAAIVLAICILPLPGLDGQALYYEPYPLLSIPTFNPLLGIAMLGLTIPGLLVLIRNTSRNRTNNSSKSKNPSESI